MTPLLLLAKAILDLFLPLLLEHFADHVQTPKTATTALPASDALRARLHERVRLAEDRARPAGERD